LRLPLLWAAEQNKSWWLPEDISTQGFKIDLLFYIILGITGTIFVVVEICLILFLLLYRSGKHVKAAYTHGSTVVEIIWTVIPAGILVFLALLSQNFWADLKGPAPEGALKVDILAEQFAWNVRYAGADGLMGTDDDIKTINQLHVPVNQPVEVTLGSIGKDQKAAVIHSFFLPELRVKQDVVPGMDTRVWFEATKTGQYEIACAEFCGLGHYRMRGFLKIETPEEFNAWLEKQAPKPPAAPVGGIS
jgi:cytochrome c oxidase subunit 2